MGISFIRYIEAKQTIRKYIIFCRLLFVLCVEDDIGIDQDASLAASIFTLCPCQLFSPPSGSRVQVGTCDTEWVQVQFEQIAHGMQ